MSGLGCRDVFHTPIAELQCVDPAEQGLAGAEQVRRNREVQLVDQTVLQVVTDRRRATSQAYILAVGGFAGTAQRDMNPVRDEVKRRPAGHHDRGPRVMRQHKDRNVVRRVVSPPALPSIAGPDAPDRSEHIATENPRADVPDPAGGEFIVNPSGAAVFSNHLLESLGREKPAMERLSADAERAFETLARAGAESVPRDGEAVNPEAAGRGVGRDAHCRDGR